MHRYFMVCLAGLLISLSGVVQAGSFLGWGALSSPHFLVYYTEGFEAKASNLLMDLESRIGIVEEVAGPVIKTALVLEDMGSISNGYANPLSNKISLWISPPESYGFALYDDWLSYVGIHEVGHIAQLTRKNNNPFQLLFGERFSLNVFTPLWFKEGLAVDIESSYSQSNGRMHDPKTRLITRQLLASGQIRSISNMTSPNTRFPYGRVPYMLGSRFVSYLSKTYGKEKLNTFIYEVAGDPLSDWDDLFYMMAPLHSFQDKAGIVFGKKFSELFNEWREFELALPLIEEGDLLDKSPYEKQWVIPITNDSFLTFVSYLLAPSPGQLVRSYKLEEIELTSGTTSVLGDYVSGMAAKPQFLNGSLYIALKEAAYGYQNMSSMGYGGIAKVIQKDVKTRKETEIFRASLRSFLPLDTSIIYFKDNLIQDASEVWEVKNGKQVKIGDCSLLVSEIVNEQGRWFVIGKTATSGWDLYELNRTSFEATRLTDTPNPEYFLSSTGEGKIIFSALKDKQTNVFERDLKTEKITQLTHSDYASFSGKVGDSLVYLTPGSMGTRIIKTSYSDDTSKKDLDVTQSQETDNKLEAILNNKGKETMNVVVTDNVNRIQKRLTPKVELRPTLRNKVMIKKEDAFTSNLSSLLIPFLRVPFSALGSDHLESVAYSTQLSSSGISLWTSFKGFMPFNISASIFSSSELEEPIIELDTTYLMHRSQTKGIQSLSASMFYQSKSVVEDDSIAYGDGYLDGMLGFGLSGTYRDSVIHTIGNIKISFLENNIGIKGHFAELRTTWVSEFSSLKIDSKIFYNFTEPVRITGRGGNYYVDEGTVYKVAYYNQLLRLNMSSDDYFTGIGDVYLKVFSDVLTDSSSSFSDATTDYSYGVALSTNLEIPIYTIIPVTLDIGLVSLKNKDNLALFVEYGFGIEF